MKFSRYFTVPNAVMLLTLLIVGIAYACGAPFATDPGTIGALGFGIVASGSGALIEPGAADPSMPWGRIYKDMPQFDTVPSSGTGKATMTITRQARTLLGMQLKLGGTTFNESHITLIVLRLGSKALSTWTGAHLRKMNAFNSYYDGNRQFLHIDFTKRNSKNYGGEMVGGIDLAKLPPGRLILEVTISGATAPTISAKGRWGQSQDSNVIQRMLQFTWSATASGRRVIPLELGGARIRALYFHDSGTDWMTTGTATAWATNTGNGTMGAVTVAANTKVGTWRLTIVEPGTNLGTFVLEDPDGNIVSVKGTVASAYSGGGIGFTLADGATDFVSGDGFDIVVSENSQGNMTRLEVIKDGDPQWDFYDDEARNILTHYGYKPQSKMYAAVFEVDGWNDGSLSTAGSKIEIAGTFTAASDLTIYAEVLDTPDNGQN